MAEKKMYQQIRFISPKLAKDWLIKNASNRKLNKDWVNDLSERIVEKQWKINGASIVFDVKDNLIDGQHRLSAIIKAEQGVFSSVTFDAEIESFATIDQGKKRNVTDTFYSQGEANATLLAAVTRSVYFHEKKYGVLPAPSTLSNVNALAVLKRNPEIRDSVEYIEASGYRREIKIQLSVAGYCHWLFNSVDIQSTHNFFEALIFGANLKKGSPILVLRNKLLAERHKKRHEGKLAPHVWAHLFVKVWNMHRLDKTCVSLQIGPKESFPVAR